MKSILLPLSLLSLFISCSSSHRKDPVMSAKELTEMKSTTSTIRDSDFLIEMADARMMDGKEGRLASLHGTTKRIRDYGTLMVQDQTKLLEQMRNLATQKEIVLPKQLSNQKRDGLKELRKLRGTKFDKKFISMITIDHERDVKAFSDASKDSQGFSQEIQQFSSKNLPLIQSHLDKINAIESSM